MKRNYKILIVLIIISLFIFYMFNPATINILNISNIDINHPAKASPLKELVEQNITEGESYINIPEQFQQPFARSSNGTLYCVYTIGLDVVYAESIDNGTTWTKGTLWEEDTYAQNPPSIAIDSNDTIYVFWSGYSPFDQYELRYTIYNVSNGTWDTVSNFTDETITDFSQSSPSLAIDENNVLHIVYVNETSGFVEYLTFDYYNEKFSGIVTFPEVWSGMEKPNIAVNESNIVMIVWAAYDFVISTSHPEYVYYNGSWSNVMNITPPLPDCNINNVDIIVDSSDNFIIVMQNYTHDSGLGSNYNGVVQLKEFINGEWGEELDLCERDSVPTYDNDSSSAIPTISIDKTGTIQVVWVGITGLGGDLIMMYNNSNASNWLAEPEILFTLPPGSESYPNLIYTMYPHLNPNIPKEGYAFVYLNYDVGPDTYNITYYANCTWEGQTPPLISNENPPIGATGIDISLETVNVTITQTDGDVFNWSIEGTFLTSNSSSSDTTGVKNASVIGPLVKGTLYIWWVNTSDNDGYNNDTYYFTTKSNQTVVFSYPNPTNGSIYVPITTATWNITIQDPEGDTFNWSIYTNPDIGYAYGYDNTNGSKSATLIGFEYNVNYTVYVNATDNATTGGNGGSVNQTFWFMATNYSVVLSYPEPANGSTGVSIATASWNITIEDPEGDYFNYSIEMNPDVGGSFGFDNTNGSKSCVLASLQYNTNYTVWVNATDNVTNTSVDKSVNETFWFYTETEYDVYVDDDADPSWYNATHVPTIIEGITNASEGQTVFVYSGTYTESPTINKNLTLISNETEKPLLIGILTIGQYLYGPIHVESFSIDGNGGIEAIRIWRANYVNITKCNLTNSGSYVILAQGRYCNISYCNITGGTFIPIRFSSISAWTEGNHVLWYNNISGSSMLDATYPSIELNTEVGGNTLIGNTIHNATIGYGVQIYDTGNLIYHNNFIDNFAHISVVGGSANTWNLSYPICGNYFSGHGTQDIYSGSDQNQSGSDLICDLTSPDPFFYNVNNIDNFPFLNPFNGQNAESSTVILSNETPTDNSGNISLTLHNVTVMINNTGTFNYSITGYYLNNTFNNGTGVSNGTYSSNISVPLPLNTEIIWNVSVFDGIHWLNVSYSFFTNREPTVTNVYPVNGSDISLYPPICHIDAADIDGDVMDICWYENTTGPWVLRQTNITMPNGTYYWNFIQANLAFTNYWWMITVNDSYTNISYIYSFLTVSIIWNNISWWNGSVSNNANNTSLYFYRPISTWHGSISNQTHGGTYNITILFENETNGVNFPVNLTANNTGIHKFIIHYTDETDYVWFNHNGVYPSHINTTVCDVSLNRSGRFSVTVQKQVKFFEFRWNDTLGREYFCTRTIIPIAYNVTMYIRTDLPVYGESTGYFNNSLVKYKLGFLDETGKFRSPNNPRIVIYKYNSSGVKQVIHSEYFDGSYRVYPWLVFNDIYYIGVECDIKSIERIGTLVASSDIEQSEIRIPYSGTSVYNIYDLIQFSYGWYANGFYVHYVDTTSSTNWVEFTVYNFTNGTLIPAATVNVSFINDYNFTFTLAQGCSLNESYKFQVNLSLNAVVSENYEGMYTTNKISILSGFRYNVTNVTLDNIFTIIFGPSPLYDVDNPSIFVPWSYIVVFGVAFILLVSFGKVNSFLGGISVGFWLTFSGLYITGLQTLNSGAVLAFIGGFIIVISFVGLLGKVER